MSRRTDPRHTLFACAACAAVMNCPLESADGRLRCPRCHDRVRPTGRTVTEQELARLRAAMPEADRSYLAHLLGRG